MYEDTPAGFAYRLDQSALLLRPYVPFYVFLGCCKTYAESVKFFSISFSGIACSAFPVHEYTISFRQHYYLHFILYSLLRNLLVPQLVACFVSFSDSSLLAQKASHTFLQ
jgi:hypothetical protein